MDFFPAKGFSLCKHTRLLMARVFFVLKKISAINFLSFSRGFSSMKFVACRGNRVQPENNIKIQLIIDKSY